jgi:AcrR family transcriptional regulator
MADKDVSDNRDLQGARDQARVSTLLDENGGDLVARSQRERLIAAMAVVCAEQGYENTTIAGIVRQAGMSRRTFYKHFGDKSECFDATVQTLLIQLRAAVEATYEDGKPWPALLGDAVAAILDTLSRDPALTRVGFIEVMNVNPLMMREFREALLDDLQARRIEAGVERDGSPTPLRMAFGRIRGLATQEVIAGRAERLPELLPTVVFLATLPSLGQQGALEQMRQAAR